MSSNRLVPWLLASLGVAVLLLVSARCQAIRVAPEMRLGAYDDAPYRSVLAAGVRDGLVDYAAVRQRAEALDRFLDAVGRFGPDSSPEDFPTERHRLAYYLNAYNAVMMHRWLSAGAGVEGGGAGRTVNRLWFVVDRWRIDGSWISLDHLEQAIIRPRFGEPRIHFALVCGALGCPPLLEEPFTAERLDEQLDALARRWLREPDGLTVGEDGSVRVSAIFEWYADDFEAMGGLAGVLDRYLDEDEARRPAVLAAARAGGIRFLEYDWSINQR